MADIVCKKCGRALVSGAEVKLFGVTGESDFTFEHVACPGVEERARCYYEASVRVKKTMGLPLHAPFEMRQTRSYWIKFAQELENDGQK